MRGRAVAVHSLDHARTALAAAKASGVPVTLLSAPAAANVVGPLFFAELVRQARAAVPDVVSDSILDCDRAAGRALAALRLGFNGVVYTGSDEVLRRLADAGEPYGCTVYGERPDALDLLYQKGDPGPALTRWLTRTRG